MKFEKQKIKNLEMHIKALTDKVHEQRETIRTLKNCVEYYAGFCNTEEMKMPLGQSVKLGPHSITPTAFIYDYTKARECLEKLGFND